MESWFCSSWISLWMLIVSFRNVSADPASPPRYMVHHTRLSFNRATQDCSPGVLTTLATEQELTDVLGIVSKSLNQNRTEFTFWVGLRKVKNECVIPTLPLRGFKWTEDGSERSQVSLWTEEPENTCTSVLCAALKGDFNGTAVTRWGLIPDTCRSSRWFICKLPAGAPEDATTPEDTSTPEDTPEDTSTPEDTPEDRGPAVEPAAPEPEPEAATPEPQRPTPPETTVRPDSGPEPQGPDPGSDPVLDSCQHPLIPGARSLSLDPDDSSRIRVECWSSVQLELHCSGRPAVWRLLDHSPANFTAVCQPCEGGFQKDASGNCVDIDECGGAPCRHACLNTVGSYRCVCSDESGKHHDEDSQTCRDMATSGDDSLSPVILIVVIAVAALVVLVVVVAVTVKCCLMRRSKKRAMKKAEKMAMRSKDDRDSFETASEKVRT